MLCNPLSMAFPRGNFITLGAKAVHCPEIIQNRALIRRVAKVLKLAPAVGSAADGFIQPMMAEFNQIFGFDMRRQADHQAHMTLRANGWYASRRGSSASKEPWCGNNPTKARKNPGFRLAARLLRSLSWIKSLFRVHARGLVPLRGPCFPCFSLLPCAPLLPAGAAAPL